MKPPATVDVLVVGAGPAGSVTAAHLCRHGFRVLLVGPATDGVPRHDVVLSAPATEALAELDAGFVADLRRIDAVHLRFDHGDRRSITGAGLRACDRETLCARLRGIAVSAGAEHRDGWVVSVAREGTGHLAVLDDGSRVRARHVVIAAGAAAPPGLAPRRAAHAAGFACAVRVAGVGRVPGMLLHPVTPAGTDPDASPISVWVVPGDSETCTVGVAVMGTPAGAVTALTGALAALAGADPAFAAARPVGPIATGPVNSGFAPDLAVHAGRLLVGDVAGLVNPFTGEGISYAVQSALLAAQAIAAHPGDHAAAGQWYRRRLAATFVGYFETARHAARRYHLAWRVLAATAHSDHPFFALGRRAVLLPAGPAGLATDRASLRRDDELFLRPFLAACDEFSLDAVRREWPFIARMLVAESGGTLRLRPATLFFTALLAAGATPDADPAAMDLASVGAAMDLAALGALAFLGPVPPADRPGRGVDWESTTIVLACDFLLAQAARLVAESAPEASWAFSDWLARLTAGRAARLGPAPAGGAAELFAAVFEFPARIGAQLAGAPPDVVTLLRDVGHHCGRAFLQAEDALALRGDRTRLDTTTRTLLAGRVSTIPELLGDSAITADRLAADSGLRASALAAVTAACLDSLRAADDAAARVPHPTSRRILRAVARSIDPSEPRRPCVRPAGPQRKESPR